MFRRTARLAAVFMLVAATFGTSSVAAADSDPLGPDGLCGPGDALRIAHAFHPILLGADSTVRSAAELCLFMVVLREPIAGICFSEDDVFVGVAPMNGGWADFRDFLAGTEITISVVEPAGVDADAVETPLRGASEPEAGTSWKQWSLVFAGLAPGTYLVETVYDFPWGDELDPTRVSFTVLPRDVASGLERPTSPLEGSVVCP